MGKKTKNRLQLALLLVILTGIMVSTWLWRAAQEPPLAIGDRVVLSRVEVGQPISLGVTLYNTNSWAARLTGIRITGHGWELAEAKISPVALGITPGVLSSWAGQKKITLLTAAGYRLKGNATATLALTLRKTSSQGEIPTLVISYRYWGLLKRELTMPLQ